MFWDTDLNKSDDFLLDPFCIYNIYAMFRLVFSVKNYTNKILFKLNHVFCETIKIIAPNRAFFSTQKLVILLLFLHEYTSCRGTH